MANNVFQNHTPYNLGGVTGVVEVAGLLIGRSIIDGLRKKFSAGDQVQEGDHLMDRSRDLLRMHFQLMGSREQDAIRKKYRNVQNIKICLENFSGSRMQRLREARKYLRLSRETYQIVKRASERGVEGRLMDQIAEAIRQSGGGSGIGPGTASIQSNSFTRADSRAISTLTDVPVNDIDRVEVSTYVARDAGEGAVVLNLVNQDHSVQHVVATFPTEAFSGERTDRESSQSIAPEALVALSLHREDGTMPRLVAASAFQDDRANEEVETRSFTSMSSSELFKSSESLELPW